MAQKKKKEKKIPDQILNPHEENQTDLYDPLGSWTGKPRGQGRHPCAGCG